jgi:hypothetical protein
MSRPLLVDGITLQLAGELLFEIGSDFEDRHRCWPLYKEALENVAYAVVFGSTLGRVGSLSERGGAWPGQTLIEHDNETLFKKENVLPLSAGPAEGVLEDEDDRRIIAAELSLLEKTFLPHGGAWVPFIQQEASNRLPDEPTADPEPGHGSRFLFKKKEIYFRNASLQGGISTRLVDTLVASLQKQFPKRPDDDLREFIERVLLTHYGISCWYEKSVKAADFQRLPFITRSKVRDTAMQAQTDSTDYRRVLSRTDAIKVRVLSETLDLAFARCGGGKRLTLYAQLLELRNGFQDHRKLLADIDFHSLPKNFNKTKVDRACDSLNRLLDGRPTTWGIFTGSRWRMPNLLLRPTLGTRYPKAAYDLFPELDSTKRERSKFTFLAPHGHIAVADTIHSLNQGQTNEVLNVSVEEKIMGDSYSSVGQVAAMGPNAQATDIKFQQLWTQEQNRLDLPQLACELRLLVEALGSEARDPEHQLDIGAIAAAEASAKAGNGPKTLEYLKKTGVWVLDVASKIGVPLAVAAIKAKAGLP